MRWTLLFAPFAVFSLKLSKSIYPQELALPEVATGFNTFALWTYVNASDPAEQSTLLDYMDRCELAHVKVDLKAMHCLEL